MRTDTRKNPVKKEFGLAVVIGIITVSLWLIGSKRPVVPLNVTIYLRDYAVELSDKVLPAAMPLHFTFINQGVVEHNVVIEKAGANNAPMELRGTPSAVGIIFPGQTLDASWTIDQPGNYQIACHLPGHYAGGMVQTFQVTPIGDFLHGTPTPLARASAAACMFLLLEAIQLGVRRAWGLF